MALVQPVLNDRVLIRQRMLAAMNRAVTLPMADKNQIAAIGFCLGGMCVLDLARQVQTLRAW